MRTFWVILLFVCVSAPAQIVTSQSGQFVVHGRAGDAPQKIPPGSTWVQPDLLAFTAERVKKALASEIPALASVGATIHLHVLQSAPADSPIGIVTTKFSDGWMYQVAIPPVVDEARLVKALAQALMVEFANRAPGHAAELPVWLVEGMAQQLFFSFGPKLVVDRNSTGWEVKVRDFQRRTREAMRTNDLPSFQQITMSSPPPANSPGEIWYQSSTHLLVNSLLIGQNGRQRFASFLQRLPATWNWQTALREAYGFERMLDVEKWWALSTLEFTMRDQRQSWSSESSLRKLDDLLATQLEVRGATNALPELRQIDLRSLARDDNWTLQRQALTEKMWQLEYTIPHLAPAVSQLAADYKEAMARYLGNRDRSGVSPTLKATPEARTQATIADFLQRIEALDVRRRAMAAPTLTSTR